MRKELLKTLLTVLISASLGYALSFIIRLSSFYLITTALANDYVTTSQYSSDMQVIDFKLNAILQNQAALNDYFKIVPKESYLPAVGDR